MKTILIALILLSSPFYCLSQSLGKERIERLNKSIVRILIDDDASGSGFIVSEDGWIASCYHVIASAFIRDSAQRVTGLRTIHAEFRNGERVRVTMLNDLVINPGNYEAVGYDYILMKMNDEPKISFRALELGSWSDVNEGDQIYSAGFPLGIDQRFMSTGVLSTKWVHTVTVNSISSGQEIDGYRRNVAWVDLTMNKGNSGGPIIKLGKNSKKDIVIGIASFILNPYSNTADAVAEYYRNRYIAENQPDRITTNRQMQILFEAISNNSIGVSGVIAIDYLDSVLQKIQ